MLEPEWVLVRPGKFNMGSSSEEDEAYPPMQVTITRPYWIQTSEVSRAEAGWAAETHFAMFGEIGLPPLPNREKAIPSLGNGEEAEAAATDFPFVFALRYANARSRIEGYEECYAIRECEPPTSNVYVWHWYVYGCAIHSVATADPDCRGYRLPTEAEWEWAARARGRSDCQRPGRCMSREAVTRETRGPEAPRIDYSTYTYIGSQCPNELGLYDMIGNVAEWTSDLRQAQEPYFYGSPLTDPTRPVPDYMITDHGLLEPPEGRPEDVLDYIAWEPRPIARGGNNRVSQHDIAPYYAFTGDERSSHGWRLVRTAFEVMDD